MVLAGLVANHHVGIHEAMSHLAQRVRDEKTAVAMPLIPTSFTIVGCISTDTDTSISYSFYMSNGVITGAIAGNNTSTNTFY